MDTRTLELSISQSNLEHAICEAFLRPMNILRPDEEVKIELLPYTFDVNQNKVIPLRIKITKEVHSKEDNGIS